MDYPNIWLLMLISLLNSFQTHTWEQVCDVSSGKLPCKLFKKTSLDCSSRHFKTFPTLAPHITNVDLSCNELKKINKSEFVMQTPLQVISLNGNRLTNLTCSPFSTLARLISLDLSNNEIHLMTVDAFNGLTSLKELILSSNQLESLNSGIFNSLKSLKKLDLSSNLFRAIPTETLSLLQSLESLVMKCNPFESFEFNDYVLGLKQLVLGKKQEYQMKMLNLTDDTFRYLQGSSLESLRLEWFGKVQVDDGILAPLNKLKSLSIPHVSKQILESIDQLEEISISNGPSNTMFPDNKLDTASLAFLKKFNRSLTKMLLSIFLITIDGSPFQNFTNLKVLNLTSNSFSSISPEIFHGLNKLETLDLSHNSMRDVPWEALSYFKNSTRFTQLLLGNNQINIFYLLKDGLSLKSLRKLDFSHNRQETSFPHFIGDSHLKSFPFHDIHPINPMDWYPIGLYPDLRLTSIAPNLEWVSFRGSGPVELDILTDSSALTYLDLSQCGLKDFDEKFQTLNLPNLEILKLSGNELSRIHVIDFKSNSLLKELDLSFNGIHIIESGTFSQLKHLTHLNLEKNNLISTKDVPSIPTLKHLNLASNLIRVVTVKFLNSFPNLEVVDLSSNSYKCDRDLFGFVDWIRSDDTVKLEPHLKYKCHPNGMDITDLDTYVFLDTVLGQFVIIGIPCIIFLLAVIGLSWYFCIRKPPQPESQVKYFDPYNDEDGLLISSYRNRDSYAMKPMKKPPAKKYKSQYV